MIVGHKETRCKQITILKVKDHCYNCCNSYSTCHFLCRCVVGASITNNNNTTGFNLKTIGGKQVSLESFKGKLLVLWFMATWCPTFVGQAGAIKQISSEYGNKISVLVADLWAIQNIGQIIKASSNSRLILVRLTRGGLAGILVTAAFIATFGLAGIAISSLGIGIAKLLPWIAVSSGIVIIGIGIAKIFGRTVHMNMPLSVSHR
jgi:thiol-disulfide isomerase/thioredoxin